MEGSKSTIRVKQGFPFSPTLFGLYINELEEIMIDMLSNTYGCFLYEVYIVILIFVDDIIFMSCSEKIPKKQLKII